MIGYYEPVSYYPFDNTRVPPRNGPPEPEPEPAPAPEPAPEPEPEPATEPQLEGSQNAESEPVEQVVEDSGTGSLTGIARRIADCESGDRLANGRAVEGSYGTHLYNQQGSSASGVFHFIDGTWQWIAGEIGASQYARASHAPLSVQLQAFEYLYDGGAGAYHWDASRSCWG